MIILKHHVKIIYSIPRIKHGRNIRQNLPASALLGGGEGQCRVGPCALWEETWAGLCEDSLKPADQGIHLLVKAQRNFGRDGELREAIWCSLAGSSRCGQQTEDSLHQRDMRLQLWVNFFPLTLCNSLVFLLISVESPLLLTQLQTFFCIFFINWLFCRLKFAEILLRCDNATKADINLPKSPWRMLNAAGLRCRFSTVS